MEPERWAKIEEIFQAALELAPSERAAFVERSCGADEELRGEVAKYIRNFSAESGFLESPIWEDSVFLRTTLKDKIADSLEKEIGSLDGEASLAGQTVGNYHLLEEIGRGGMGVVYTATRTTDFRQKVAVKIVKRGMETDFVLRRFRQERQVLAALNHPNIARLLDGGATEDGRPFLVMEYIKGLPVDRYCDRHKLSIPVRLKLFREICAAVEYSHQRLIIHRDIKPSNILVTADGTPKLLDFGIAKLLDQTLADESAQTTMPGARLLTPDYASPEQLRGASITTVSDVYSLGVLLYCLLTGHLPFRYTDGKPDRFAEMVSEQRPPRPSQMVTARVPTTAKNHDKKTAEDSLNAIADNRRTQPKRLSRYLADDLDNIVLKALRKEPERRYATVEQFSEDLRRHLEGLPVKARGDDFFYRTRKLIQRRKLAVAGSLLLFVSLAGGLTATAWQANIARQQQAQAEESGARAQRRFDESRRLSESLMFELHDAIRDLPGATAARELLAKRTLEHLDQLALDAAGDANLQSDLVIAYINLGNIQGNPYYANLGDQPAALASYRKAEKLAETLSAANPSDTRLRRRYWLTQIRIGDVLTAQGNLAEAGDYYTRALSVIENLASENPANESFPADLASTYDRQGNLAVRTNDYPAAISFFNRAQEIFVRSSQARPADDGLLRAVGAGYGKIGTVYLKSGDAGRALENYRRLLQINEERFAASPGNAAMQDDAISSRRELADAQTALGELKEAEANYRQVLADYQRLQRTDPANVKTALELAVSHERLGRLETKIGEFPAARTNQERALAIFNELKQNNPGNALIARQIPAQYFYLWETSKAAADKQSGSERNKTIAAACTFLRRSVETYGQSQNAILPDGINSVEEIKNKLASCGELSN